MPLALDPNQVFQVVLECDKEKPKAKRPYFSIRFLSGRDLLEVDKLDARVDTAKTGRQALEFIYDILHLGIAGWGNIKDRTGKEIPFELSRLGEILCLKDAAELRAKMVSPKLGVKVLKNSDLQSGSDTEPAAKTVRGRKRAKTSRRKRLPSK